MVHNRKATPEPQTIDHSFAAVTFRAFPAPCLLNNLAAPEACGATKEEDSVLKMRAEWSGRLRRA